MSNVDFFGLLYAVPWTFIGCLVLSILLYVIVFRKWFVSILDPFLLSIISSVFGFAVVLFLWQMNEIESYYLASYLLTQGALISGMLIFNRIKFKEGGGVKIKNEERVLQLIFLVICIFTIGAQLLIYATKGIPLFMTSRLEANQGGDGAGIFFRFLPVFGSISIILSIYYIEHRSKFRSLGILMLCLMVLFFILSGSKGAIWTLATCLFGYAVLFSKRLLYGIKRRQLLVALVGGLFAVFTIILSTDSDFGDSVLTFLFRFVFNGDTYWAAYPDASIEAIERANPFVVIFSDFLGMLRIVPWSEQPEILGIELYNMHQVSDGITGPNGRHNVLGYILFGFGGSIIFSFIIGAIIGYVRNLFFTSTNKSTLIKIAIILIYCAVYGMETDLVYTLSIFNSLVFLTILIVFVLLLCHIDFSKKPKLVKNS